MSMNMDSNQRDPFRLAELPLLEPDRDGWPEIRQALEVSANARRGRRQAGVWLAVAAAVVLAIGVAMQRAPVVPAQDPAMARTGGATPVGPAASYSHADEDTLNELIAMSQLLERRLRGLRDEAGPMPARSALYIVELEDLIVRVDRELSMNPASMDLWGQRVNLLLDLELIFKHQWQREYGRLASL